MAGESALNMRSHIRAVALVLGLTCIVVASLGAQSGKVSGTLVVNGKKLAVQHITAVTYDTPSPGRLVSVLVSMKAPNPKTFQEYTRIGPGERNVAGTVTGAWVTMHTDKELDSSPASARCSDPTS